MPEHCLDCALLRDWSVACRWTLVRSWKRWWEYRAPDCPQISASASQSELSWPATQPAVLWVRSLYVYPL